MSEHVLVRISEIELGDIPDIFAAIAVLGMNAEYLVAGAPASPRYISFSCSIYTCCSNIAGLFSLLNCLCGI